MKFTVSLTIILLLIQTQKADKYNCNTKNSKCNKFLTEKLIPELQKKVKLRTSLKQGHQCMRGDKWELITTNSVDFNFVNLENKIHKKYKTMPINNFVNKNKFLKIEVDAKLKKGCYEYICSIITEYDKKRNKFYGFEVTCPLRNRIPGLGVSGEDWDCSIVSVCKNYLDTVVLPEFIEKVKIQKKDAVSKNYCWKTKTWTMVEVKYAVRDLIVSDKFTFLVLFRYKKWRNYLF